MTNQAKIDNQEAVYIVRIQAGVAWLNNHVPDWRARITKPVNLDSPCHCILGQSFRHMASRVNPDSPYNNLYNTGYEYAVKRKMSFPEAEAYGFTTGALGGYELLTKLWCQELATPRSVAP